MEPVGHISFIIWWTYESEVVVVVEVEGRWRGQPLIRAAIP